MTKMYVNLENIKHNLNEFRKKLPKDINIIAMVKADAYGLGDINIANFLEKNGVNFFGVAHVNEAVHLRENNILCNILVTSQFLEEDIKNIVDYDISVTLSNLEYIQQLNEYAKEKNKTVKVHIKIDTGMSRLGFILSSFENTINELSNYSNIKIDGIYSHLSSADSDYDYTLKQINTFETGIKILEDLNIKPKYIHILNSAGILNFTKYCFNTVRIGDSLYGYYPDNSLREKITLKPSVKIESKIINIQTYPKGTKISYNQTYTLEKDSKIATVQMGYADGLFRNLSNKFYVKINNTYCKIIGNICMDMFMCDITDLDKVNIGDSVTILDFDDSIYEMSKIAGTINYEILSRISRRVEREYIEKI